MEHVFHIDPEYNDWFDSVEQQEEWFDHDVYDIDDIPYVESDMCQYFLGKMQRGT